VKSRKGGDVQLEHCIPGLKKKKGREGAAENNYLKFAISEGKEEKK